MILFLNPVRTGPSFADAAMGRIAQGTKVLAEGGHEKIFRQTFDAQPEEQLRKSYACYLSTSAGPVMGVLYLSTAKLAFCSDNPLSYKAGDQTEWSYYKVSASRLFLSFMHFMITNCLDLCTVLLFYNNDQVSNLRTSHNYFLQQMNDQVSKFAHFTQLLPTRDG